MYTDTTDEPRVRKFRMEGNRDRTRSNIARRRTMQRRRARSAKAHSQGKHGRR